MTSRTRHEEVFSRIYARHEWGDDESLSGPGSGLARTAELREAFPILLCELEVERLVDAGCGDFNWLRRAELPVREYIGIDVVPELVTELEQRHAAPGRRFVCGDITSDPLPDTDFVLCREVLMHFPDDDVIAAVANMRRTGARWLLTTTFTERSVNDPIELGWWRPLNLEAPPFEFPPPLRVLDDVPLVDGERYADKRLSLWDFSTLP